MQIKAPTGITGFDEITGGGLPRGRTTLLAGGPGSGKTIFALQFLVHGARYCDEPGIFVAFEETPKRIAANFETFGWNLAALQKRKLFFLDARPTPDLIQSGTFDLSGMLAALGAKIKEMGARRIVFDLSSARVATSARADRNHHGEGRRGSREFPRPTALRLYAIHGGLRRHPQPQRGTRRVAAQSARAEVPGLQLR
jgi:KaiC/GvpD/RAD55 family RecA-like ATPase